MAARKLSGAESWRCPRGTSERQKNRAADTDHHCLLERVLNRITGGPGQARNISVPNCRSSRWAPMLSAMRHCFASPKRSPLAGSQNNWHEFLLPPVNCNFPGCIASNLPLNPYFCEAMRSVVKLGVSLLSLLLFAVPIMACVLPAMAMSAEERECCKRMAQECGNTGMGKSHSCCQTVSVPDHLPAIKSSSDVGSKPLALAFILALPPIPTMALILESGSSSWATDIHSPPVSPPGSISVLRI